MYFSIRVTNFRYLNVNDNHIKMFKCKYIFYVYQLDFIFGNRSIVILFLVTRVSSLFFWLLQKFSTIDVVINNT